MSSKKRHVMYLNIEKSETPSLPDVKLITTADGRNLGHLMYEAYQGTVDYEGETLDESIQEIEGTLVGKYGDLIEQASLMAVDSGKIVSAVIFVSYKKEGMPLLAFTMTHPDYRGRGLSQKLIKLAANNLANIGHAKCCLVVTDGNQPAQSIYEKLGFTYKQVSESR
ncbi:MAG: GNAT family N-acetyltransferase [Bacteriovoracaceae bacterium]